MLDRLALPVVQLMRALPMFSALCTSGDCWLQVHSRRKSDSLLASALLATVNYMWWQLGHLAHHVNVRSPQKTTHTSSAHVHICSAGLHAWRWHCHSRLPACVHTHLQAWMTRQSARCRWASLTIRRPRGAGRPCTSSCHAASWGTCVTARRPSSSACAPATSPPGAPAAGAKVADFPILPGGVEYLALCQPALLDYIMATTTGMNIV